MALSHAIIVTMLSILMPFLFNGGTVLGAAIGLSALDARAPAPTLLEDHNTLHERAETVAATATPSDSTSSASCIAASQLMINFDDEPHYSSDNNYTHPAIISPYHHLYWAGGWGYDAQPRVPYAPHSKPQLGLYQPAGENSTGYAGAGPRASDPRFHFDAHDVWVGCYDDGSEGTCHFNVTGLRWDPATKTEVKHINTSITVPPCPSLDNCTLQHGYFPAGFTNLSGMTMAAYVTWHLPILYFVDNINMSWSDTSCTAVQARGSQP